MTSQIFKNRFPNSLFFELLNKICVKNEKYYLFNLDAFKKGVYNDYFQCFFEVCKPYYFLSKHKYFEKKIMYNTFSTILRQICNYNNILYTSRIIYNKSKYNIVYYIYF
jgi:hypothetical protein